MAIADHDLTVIQQWCAGRVPDHSSLGEALDEIERDPDGAFWG